MKKVRLLLVCIPCVVATGCASVMMHTLSEGGHPILPGVYRGVRTDAILLAHPNSVDSPVIPPVLLRPLCFLDLAPSAVLDTLLLPVDLISKSTKEKKEVP